jgi:hypothetical protein
MLMGMSTLRWIADSGRIFHPAITCGFHHPAVAEVPRDLCALRRLYSFPSTSLGGIMP